MSEILKTEAIVLSKLNYGDTSSIAQLFTKEAGRLGVIVKGGRNPKSKYVHLIDPLNLVSVVIYRKENRELQILSSADLSAHYPGIKANLEKLKYSYGVLELVKSLIPEHEVNIKLFRAINRIMELFEISIENNKVLFGRFFMFFISMLGYEIQLDVCAYCGKTTSSETDLSYSSQLGILCNDCSSRLSGNLINRELFNYLTSLKLNRKAEYDEKTYDTAIAFMEKYLKNHIPDFQGLQSLKMFKMSED